MKNGRRRRDRGRRRGPVRTRWKKINHYEARTSSKRLVPEEPERSLVARLSGSPRISLPWAPAVWMASPVSHLSCCPVWAPPFTSSCSVLSSSPDSATTAWPLLLWGLPVASQSETRLHYPGGNPWPPGTPVLPSGFQGVKHTASPPRTSPLLPSCPLVPSLAFCEPRSLCTNIKTWCSQWLASFLSPGHAECFRHSFLTTHVPLSSRNKVWLTSSWKHHKYSVSNGGHSWTTFEISAITEYHPHYYLFWSFTWLIFS